MAFMMRFMLALKPVLEGTIWKVESDSHGMLLSGEDCNEDLDQIKEQYRTRSTGHGFQRVMLQLKGRWGRWRLATSGPRAVFEVLLAVVGYLLMLAVMTMNVGYFLSVIAGVFLGTFALGDLATTSSLYQEHHC
ncbi:hypothetical protein JX265_003796 [Neoarthrinium moseri]|uniref:Copper transport protein n=1 Tax=Neoarthrinium moseri TaxID=1658444 RepID=A0A9P9WSX3_9PEZI|nr:hypothetical protein JX265_003796 [Neoarthrinium moseri]